MRNFQVAGGSVTGRAHAVLGRGNQDAFAWRENDGALVAVVCDGCSSGRHSEVGAHLGARLVATAVGRGVAAGADVGRHDFWDGVRDAVLAELRRLAGAMGGDLAHTVEEFFLFTVVGAAVGAERAVLFSVGDGLVVVDGAATRLGPFPGNEPPYLAYGLLGEAAARTGTRRDGEAEAAARMGTRRGDGDDGPRFVLHAVVPSAAVGSLLIGSDGAADLLDRHPLDELWSDDRCFTNPDAVRRRLTVLARPGADGPGLADDATVVVVRRAGAAAARETEASCASG
jgi:hypothetical protein